MILWSFYHWWKLENARWAPTHKLTQPWPNLLSIRVMAENPWSDTRLTVLRCVLEERNGTPFFGTLPYQKFIDSPQKGITRDWAKFEWKDAGGIPRNWGDFSHCYAVKKYDLHCFRSGLAAIGNWRNQTFCRKQGKIWLEGEDIWWIFYVSQPATDNCQNVKRIHGWKK